MKIKTVINQSAAEFDKEVNAAIAEGYELTARLSTRPEGFIAELVLQDPHAAPEIVNPYQALHLIKAICVETPDCDHCVVSNWCHKYAGETDPCCWELPGVLDT